MTSWTNDELDRIGRAEELQIASLQRDGTLRKWVTIWMVRVGDAIYVRPVNGRTSVWFRGTHTCPGGRCQGTRNEGQIRAGGILKEVSFVEEPDAGINEQIDAAYRAEYRHYAASIVNSVETSEARAATIKVVPR